MTTATLDVAQDVANLDERTMPGFGTVTLDYLRPLDSLRVTCVRDDTGETFCLHSTEGREALDMYRHPFAYRTLDSVVIPGVEPARETGDDDTTDDDPALATV